jgi:hypothetical protein
MIWRGYFSHAYLKNKNMAIKKQNFTLSQIASKYSSKTTYKPDRFFDLGDAFLDATG